MLEKDSLGASVPEPGSSSDPAMDAGTAGSPGVAASNLPMEPDSEAIRRLESEVSEARDRHLRLAAEFDNFRKRVMKEREEMSGRAQAALAVKLLDVLDDLDRLVAGSSPNGANDATYQAIVLVDRKLRKELEAAGLERLDPVGQPFDPTVHEAVSVAPPRPGQEDHTVGATFQAGYRFKGNLIRPARVQVLSSEGHT